MTRHERFIDLAESFGPVSELSEDVDRTFPPEDVSDVRCVAVNSDIVV